MRATLSDDQPQEVKDYCEAYLHMLGLLANAHAGDSSDLRDLIDMSPNINIPCIDNHEEHSPSASEWKQLRKHQLFVDFTKVLGGIESVRRVKSGTKPVCTNWRDVKKYLDEHDDCKIVCGWYILIGKPTMIMFNPHFWVEKDDGSWIAISGEGDENMCLATPREEHMKLLFNQWSYSGETMKSVVHRPLFDNHQSLEQFNLDGEWTNTTYAVPVPSRFESMLNFEEEKDED